MMKIFLDIMNQLMLSVLVCIKLIIQYFKHYIDTLKSADKYLKQGASIEQVLTKLLTMTRV